MGLVSIIFWALLFTMMIKSCTSSYANMGTVEVPYTTFKEWLAEDKIDTVNVENGKYTFTLRDGVEVELPREETSGGSGSLMNSLIPVPAQTEEEKQYITVPLAGVDDPELLAMLEEHADHAYTEPVDESAYFLSLILSYVLPLLLMVGLMMFLFRGIGGKGGMGGLGGAAVPYLAGLVSDQRGLHAGMASLCVFLALLLGAAVISLLMEKRKGASL